MLAKAKNLFWASQELPRVIQERQFATMVKPWLKNVPSGDGHGVIVIPGFLGSDEFNKPLCEFLSSKGYRVTGWRQGRNLGPREEVLAGLRRELEFLLKLTDKPVSLIGHSLGGVYAREIAKEAPEVIRQVISLGSPINQPEQATTPTAKLFRTLNSEVKHKSNPASRQLPPPVPTTAVYSKTDCVVKWQHSMQRNGHEQCENIQVHGSHCGLTVNASVWYLLADRLAQPVNGWQPLQRSPWHNVVYPK